MWSIDINERFSKFLRLPPLVPERLKLDVSLHGESTSAVAYSEQLRQWIEEKEYRAE